MLLRGAVSDDSKEKRPRLRWHRTSKSVHSNLLTIEPPLDGHPFEQSHAVLNVFKS